MMPSSPRRPLPLLPLLAAACALALAGCEKAPEDEDTPTRARTQTTRLPAPSPTASPDRASRKALNAFTAVSEYLKDQNPELRGKLQKAAERFAHDKDKWRARLKDRQRALQPRIARLRDQLVKAEGKSADALHGLRQELASLESQRNDAEHKLSELESITDDAWKSFQDHLNLDDEPTPTPASQPR